MYPIASASSPCVHGIYILPFTCWHFVMWPVAVGPFVCLQDKKNSSSCIYFFPFVFCPLYVGPVFGEDAKKILRRRHTKYKKKITCIQILAYKKFFGEDAKKNSSSCIYFFPFVFWASSPCVHGGFCVLYLYFAHCVFPLCMLPLYFVCCPLYVGLLSYFCIFFPALLCVGLLSYFFFFALLYGPLYVVLLFSISSFALVYYALPPKNTVPFAQNTVPFACQKLFPLHTKHWYHKTLFPLHTKHWYRKTLFPLHTKSYRIVPN